MRCPGCGSENDDAAKFCPGCGARMAPAPEEGNGQEPGPDVDGWEHLRSRREGGLSGSGPALAASGAYGGFWRRAVALAIDQLLLAAASWIVGLGLGVALAFSSTAETHGMEAFEDMFMIVGLCLSWGWFALFESSPWQATPGKRIMGLMVTDLSGNRIGFGRATGRWLGKLPSGILLLGGYIMAAFTKKCQALHDIMAGTLVLRRL